MKQDQSCRSSMSFNLRQDFLIRHLFKQVSTIWYLVLAGGEKSLCIAMEKPEMKVIDDMSFGAPMASPGFKEWLIFFCAEI